MSRTPGHVALLGDSIFDNLAYTAGEPDVVAHLRVAMPGWQATLLAVDGATTLDVHDQIERVPQGATHVVISAGGNDALRNVDLLGIRSTTGPHFWAVLADRQDEFRAHYEAMLDAALERTLPVAACTIYEGWLEGEGGRHARAALSLFNDVIVREAALRRIPVLDLRAACRLQEHYANPIEPSGEGGRRIAALVAAAIRGECGTATCVYVP
jgi:hypothetical protein